ILIRLRKLPPSTSLAEIRASILLRGSAGVIWPPEITDWGESGRLTSTMCGALGRGGGALNCLMPAGVAGVAQEPNSASISGWISARGRSDTTNIFLPLIH